jgi:thioredoxin 1
MGPLIVTDTSFQKEVLDEKETYVLVDFWAEWCGPCKMLAPTLNAISEKFKGKVKVCKLDVDANGVTAQKYTITSIPCNILFKDGQEIDRIIGHRTESQFTSELQTLLNK